MSSLFNTHLAVAGLTNQIDRPQAQLDWTVLQRAIALNIPTLGTDPVASGADYSGSQDSTKAIQAILNSTSLVGQAAVLYLRPNSIFTISSPLILQAGALTIIYGGGIIQLAPGANCDAIQTSATPCQLAIRDITFLGGVGSLNALKLTAGSNSVIENCSFFLWGVAGVNITPVAGQVFVGLAISDSLFADNITADINLDSTNGSISGIRIADNQLDSLIPLKVTRVNTLTYTARGNTGLNAPLYDASFDWPTPKAVAYQNAGQVIPTATITPLTFNLSSINQASVWSAGSPTRLTAKASGTYLATGQLSFAGAAVVGSFQTISIRLNGGVTTPLPLSNVVTSAGGLPTVQVSAIFSLVIGDYIEFTALQSDGANKTTNPLSTWGSLTWLSNP